MNSSLPLSYGDLVHDPFGVSHYLRLCEAIEGFTSAWTAHDPAVFRVRGADLRYVVERYLFFALLADPALYRHFVAREVGGWDGEMEPLAEPASLIAPFFGPGTVEPPT